MRIKEKKRNTACGLAVFLLAVFAGTWLLTKMTPLVGDDFNYAFSWADDTRVDNFTLVVKSMISHRQWTHGRVFAQGWVTLFMMWPRWVFPLANAAVVTCFFAALHHFLKHTGVRSPVWACLMIAVFFWICMPAFGQVFLWLDGACNYFWGASLAWVLLELKRTAKDSKYAPLWTTFLLPLAFAAGAWSEHISLSVLTIQFLMLIVSWIQRKKISVMDGLVLFASCTGYLFLMFAPSMIPTVLKIRAIDAMQSHLKDIFWLLKSKWWELVGVLVLLVGIVFFLRRAPNWRSRMAMICVFCTVICFASCLYFAASSFSSGGLWALVSSTQVGFLFLMGCFFLCLLGAIRNNVQKESLYQPIVFAVGGLCALIPFSVAFYVPARGFCAPVVFISIATVLLWNCIEQQHPKYRCIVMTVLGGLFLLCFIPGMIDLIHVEQAAAVREQKIREALASDGILYAEPYPVKTKYSAQYGIQDISEGEYWPNEIIVKYYGLKEIVVRKTASENSP